MSNYEILNAYGLTKSTFGFDSDTQGINNNEPYGQINTNDSNILRYSNFNFDLEVSELSNNLRIGILIFTIIVFLLFFTSWYLQFYIGEKLDKMQKELNNENKPENDETKDNSLAPNNNTTNYKTTFQNY
jgi:hypothetical protein